MLTHLLQITTGRPQLPVPMPRRSMRWPQGIYLEICSFCHRHVEWRGRYAHRPPCSHCGCHPHPDVLAELQQFIDIQWCAERSLPSHHVDRRGRHWRTVYRFDHYGSRTLLLQ